MFIQAASRLGTDLVNGGDLMTISKMGIGDRTGIYLYLQYISEMGSRSIYIRSGVTKCRRCLYCYCDFILDSSEEINDVMLCTF